MPSTMDLLQKALKHQNPPEWARTLGLERTALHNAKRREHLSPAVAFAIAEELGEDASKWALIAAAESEKDSACKTRMLKRLSGARKLYLSTLSTRGVVGQRINHPHNRTPRNAGRRAKLPRH